MPIGYLVTTSLRRLRCGLWRSRRCRAYHSSWGHSSFVAGFALNELPFIAAVWLAVSTLLALDQTGLGSPVEKSPPSW